jgi:ribonuclease HII
MYACDKNAGYGTKVHRDAIMEYGPCKIHRKTFIKNFWGGKGN